MKASVKRMGEMEGVCGCKTEGVKRWREAEPLRQIDALVVQSC